MIAPRKRQPVIRSAVCAGTLLLCGLWDSAWAVKLISLGGSLNQSQDQEALEPSLAMDASNAPYAAWAESNGDTLGGYQIYVKKWTGAAWERVGEAVNADLNQRAGTPSLAVLGVSPYTVHVAWAETTAGRTRILVKKKDTAGWVEVGGALNLGAYSGRHPALAFQGSRLFAAWSENNGNSYQIYVRYFEAGTWMRAGGGDPDGSLNVNAAVSADRPCLAVGSDNVLHIAWEEGGDIYARRWNGTAWIREGQAGSEARLNLNPASSPSLALDGNSIPAVAWSEQTGGVDRVFVKLLASNQWQALGGFLNRDSAASAVSPSLAGGNCLRIAWSEDQKIYLKTWDGRRTCWNEDGGCQNLAPLNPARAPVLAAGAETYLAWNESADAGDYQIFAGQWPRPPSMPSLHGASAGISAAFPVFNLSGANLYNHPMQFVIEVSSDTEFNSILKRFDQTAGGAGWSAAGYNPGVTAAYAMQAADGPLEVGAYYWRAAAYDTVYGIRSDIAESGWLSYTVPPFAYPAPTISSSTHPSNMQWYSRRTVQLSWDAPPQAATWYYLLNGDGVTRPDPGGTSISGASLSLTLPGDGAWYFHLLYKDSAGNASDTAHFPIHADTLPPQILSLGAMRTDETTVRMSWSAGDAAGNTTQVSGVDGFSWILDRAGKSIPNPAITAGKESGSTDFTGLAGGLWYFHIRAADAAGNWSTATTQAVQVRCGLLPADQVRCVPNPVFQGPARIRFYLREGADIRLDIYTANGLPVRSQEAGYSDEGTHTLEWNIGGVPNGVYLYRLNARSRNSGEEASFMNKLVVAR